MKIINRHVLFSSNTPFVLCPAFAALAVLALVSQEIPEPQMTHFAFTSKMFLSQNILKRLGQDGSRG